MAFLIEHDITGHTFLLLIQANGTGSRPRCPLQSLSLVCIENNLFIVGLGPILIKELKFIHRSDFYDHTYTYS